MKHPTLKIELYEAGVDKVDKFCITNDLPMMKQKLTASKDWMFDPCAYYRAETTHLCMEKMCDARR